MTEERPAAKNAASPLPQASVAQWVTDVITSFGGTQEQLAEQVKISPTRLSTYMQEKAPVPERVVAKFIEFFGHDTTVDAVRKTHPLGWVVKRHEATELVREAQHHDTQSAAAGPATPLPAGNHPGRKETLTIMHETRRARVELTPTELVGTVIAEGRSAQRKTHADAARFLTDRLDNAEFDFYKNLVLGIETYYRINGFKQLFCANLLLNEYARDHDKFTEARNLIGQMHQKLRSDRIQRLEFGRIPRPVAPEAIPELTRSIDLAISLREARELANLSRPQVVQRVNESIDPAHHISIALMQNLERTPHYNLRRLAAARKVLAICHREWNDTGEQQASIATDVSNALRRRTRQQPPWTYSKNRPPAGSPKPYETPYTRLVKMRELLVSDLVDAGLDLDEFFPHVTALIQEQEAELDARRREKTRKTLLAKKHRPRSSKLAEQQHREIEQRAEIATLISKLRLSLPVEVSVRTLAEVLEISPAELEALEAGSWVSNPSAATIEKILSHLGASDAIVASIRSVLADLGPGSAKLSPSSLAEPGPIRKVHGTTPYDGLQTRPVGNHKRGQSRTAKRRTAQDPAVPASATSRAATASERKDLPHDHIARFILDQLVTRNMTPRQLSSLLGTAKPQLSKHLAGEVSISRQQLQHILDVLELSKSFTVEDLQSEFPAGHNYAAVAMTPAEKGTERVARAPAWRRPVIETDEAFMAALDSQLIRQGARDVSAAGWAWLVTALRKADRTGADGRDPLLERLEAAGGRSRFGELQQVLRLARTKLSDAEQERGIRIVTTVANQRIIENANTLSRSLGKYHFPRWGDSPWPRIGAAVEAARQLAGLSREELAAAHDTTAACIAEIESGGGYDPRFSALNPRDGSRRRVDLRTITAGLLPALGAHPEVELLAPQLAALQPVLQQELARDFDTYRRLLEARTPGADDEWRNAVLSMYRARRAGQASREDFANDTGLPLQEILRLEEGGDPYTHDGHYRMQRALKVAGDAAKGIPDTTRYLSARKRRLDAAYLATLGEQDGSERSAVAWLALALLDRRAERNWSPTRLARTLHRGENDVRRAEAGFIEPHPGDGELADDLLDALEFSEAQQQKHSAALAVVREKAALAAAAKDSKTAPKPVVDILNEPGSGSQDEEEIDRETNSTDYASGSATRLTRAITVGNKRDFLDAPGTGNFLEWQPGSTLIMVTDTIPPEAAMNLAEFGPLQVYLRSGTPKELGKNPELYRARLRKALPHIKAGRLTLRPTAVEHESLVPHDFRAIDDGTGPVFVNDRNEEVNVSALLIDKVGDPLLETQDSRDVGRTYAAGLIESLQLETSRTQRDDLTYWRLKLDELNRLCGGRHAPRRPISYPTPVHRTAGLTPQRTSRGKSSSR